MKTATTILMLRVAFFATVSVRTITIPSLNLTFPKPPAFPGLTAKPDGCTCGERKNSRIVGGTAAQNGQFPWRVRLCTGRPGAFSCSSCGATIISEQWILTAAHCFDSYQLGYYVNIFVGSTDAHGYLVMPDRLVIHEKYKPLTSNSTSQNDIALLHLPIKLPFDNPNILLGPACLPYQYVGKEELGKVIASGWGKTVGNDDGSSSDTLQTVELDLVSIGECREIDRGITNMHVCTNTPNKTVCHGDSGGSIDKVSKGLSYAFGIVSYGSRYCEGYAAFTRVSEYLTWIEEWTGENFCKPLI
ncbi:unnamed protein product [Allacma fusca]|uniref:Peptidase S1 domain-containing protein n=1 Tax=Allacma fusca TaxID=39272 RepID=A0A8J2KWT0_9HEXA|nr:unnamed protein product [Allacma fusca]